jgi:beta-mannosidase
MSQSLPINLSKTCNWSFAQVEGVKPDDAVNSKAWKWFDIKQGDMPTSVHVELIKQGVIKDPYKGMNEYDVQVSSWPFACAPWQS